MIIDTSTYLQSLAERAIKAVKAQTPRILGTKAVSAFKRNFQDEAFFGEKWQEVKRRTNPKTKGAARVRKILTGRTGDLGRSITWRDMGDGNVEVFSDAKSHGFHYGTVHNYGLRAGRGKGFTMPQRQFIGEHPKLIASLRESLQRIIDNLKI